MGDREYQPIHHSVPPTGNKPSAKYLQDSSELLVWFAFRAGLQMLSVILVAKLLGASEYGYFVATLATVSLFSPLAGLGMHAVIVRDGSPNPSGLPALTAQAIAIWWKSALLLSLVATAVARSTLDSGPEPLWIIGFFAASEIMTSSGIEIIARARQAERKMRSFGALQAGLIASRLVAIGILALTNAPRSHDYFLFYGICSLAYLGLVLRCYRYRSHTAPPAAKTLLRAGIPFWSGALSLRLQTEFNKPVLAQLSLSDTGNFNIAQRAVDMGSLPIIAMQEALLPRLLSASDNRKLFRLAWFYLTVSSMFMSLLILMFAPLIPVLLGSEFQKTASLVSGLAWLPVLQVQRSMANAWVIANGLSARLTVVYILNAACAIITILVSVRLWGAAGVVYAAYFGEALLTLALLTTSSFRKSPHHD